MCSLDCVLCNKAAKCNAQDISSEARKDSDLEANDNSDEFIVMKRDSSRITPRPDPPSSDDADDNACYTPTEVNTPGRPSPELDDESPQRKHSSPSCSKGRKCSSDRDISTEAPLGWRKRPREDRSLTPNGNNGKVRLRSDIQL